VNYRTDNSGLPNNTVEAVLVANDGSIWVGTGYGGVAHLTFPESVDGRALPKFQAYPLPCSDRLFVRGSGITPGDFWLLFDGAGRKVGTGAMPMEGTGIDLSLVPGGIYTLFISTASASVAFQVPIVH
jgi:hypothetical protein